MILKDALDKCFAGRDILFVEQIKHKQSKNTEACVTSYGLKKCDR